MKRIVRKSKYNRHCSYESIAKGKKLIDGKIKVGDKIILYSEFMKTISQ